MKALASYFLLTGLYPTTVGVLDLLERNGRLILAELSKISFEMVSVSCYICQGCEKNESLLCRRLRTGVVDLSNESEAV